MKFSDKEIATLLNEVSESLAKSEKAMKKALPGEEAPPVEDAAPAMDAAPEAAPAEQAPEVGNEAPPVEGEQALEQEGDQPLTDEELTQVYSAMEPEEIERHFMVIREILQGIYGDQGEEQMEGEGGAPEMDAAPAPEASPAGPPAMEAPPEQAPDEEAFKSENKILKSEIAGLKAGLGNLAKAMEAMAPQRKSYTGILQKSEDTSTTALSKSDLNAKISEIVKKPTLTKSDRSTINTYCLTGVGAEEVMKIITNHGGK